MKIITRIVPTKKKTPVFFKRGDIVCNGIYTVMVTQDMTGEDIMQHDKVTFSGTVLDGKGIYPRGYTFHDWEVTQFREFHGKVELITTS